MVIKHSLLKPIEPYSLVVFRIGFGLLMLFSSIRFILKGWVHDFYTVPTFHFTYLGFSWIKPFPEWGMMLLFIGLAVLSLCIALGLFYRISSVLFFLGFTYVELIDKTYYLNHYYAISLFSFLMMFLPLHRAYSIDVWRQPSLKWDIFPQWMSWVLQAQIGIIYFFAGVAKINADWLLHAQPLKLWLASSGHIPIIGHFLRLDAVAYVMSWSGMLYDVLIPFFLLYSRTRPYAYATVIGFHFLTSLLFPIGVFPWAMMVLTLVFFSPDWPRRCGVRLPEPIVTRSHKCRFNTVGIVFFALYFFLQLTLPMRYLLYPGELFWTEEGFRFSWRVMLIEKNGMIEFLVKDPKTGQMWVEYPHKYLTRLQEKMMSTQPDMILQFAHYLGNRYKGIHPGVEVYARSSFVALNGRKSQPFIDPEINLYSISESFKQKKFILPFK